MTDTNPTRAQVPVRFIKSNHFRVVVAEGAFGGVSPHGVIQTSFYSERSSLPRAGIVHVSDDGSTADEITDTDGGVTREIEVLVSMRLHHAKAYHDWLGQKIVELENALQAGGHDVS